MALILVNGVALPSPSEMSVGVMDLSKAERNANGMMLIERISTKRKLEFSYAYLSSADLQEVLLAISPVFFNVLYPDPIEGHKISGTFYVGDRNMGMLDYINGVPRYKDVSFNFIEK